MVDLAAVAKDLKREEGFVGHVYQDHLGFWTIGYGRMIDERRGGKITKREGEYLLNNDILGCLKDLDRNIPWWRGLPEPYKRGLALMCYQLGWPSLSGFKKMLEALEAENRQEAYDQALDSKWARQTPGRALRVASLFLKHRQVAGR